MRALAAAAGTSAVLAAMLFASRLPPSADFLLPRRGGYALFRAAWALFSVPGGKAVFALFCGLALLACAAAVAVALRRAAKGRWPASWNARAGLAAGPLFAAALAVRLCGHWLDLLQLVWFPYGSMDAREPLAAFALFALALVPAAAAAREWTAGRRRNATLLFLALAALDVGGAFWAAARGAGRPLGVHEPSGRTLYLALTEEAGKPSHDVYVLSPDVFAGVDRRPELRDLAARPRDARALPALRLLYEEETKRWDLRGLHDALLLGASRGDLLAPALLLAHLSVAPPSAEALATLGALSDERVWRVGPLGAAALSRVAAHLGDRDGAKFWAERAAGPRGVAPGLLDLASGGALRPGRIAGTLRAPSPARVALYAKTDPAAPYLLDAAGLVASAEPDARGRFSFKGLAAGRYYLVFSFPADENPRGEVSVSGSRGDLLLDARRPSLDLPPLTIKLSPR